MIGQRIREMRVRIGIKTQAELAERVGVDVSRITRWERGDNFPDGPFREKLKIVLKVDDSFFDIDQALVSIDEIPSLRALLFVFGNATEGQRERILGYADSLVSGNQSQSLTKPKSS